MSSYFPLEAKATSPTPQFFPKPGSGLSAKTIPRTVFATPMPQAHELNFGELTIKALLGHARLGVTSGYVARVDDLLLAAADKVARYVWRSMTGESGDVVWPELRATELPRLVLRN